MKMKKVVHSKSLAFYNHKRRAIARESFDDVTLRFTSMNEAYASKKVACAAQLKLNVLESNTARSSRVECAINQQVCASIKELNDNDSSLDPSSFSLFSPHKHSFFVVF